MGVLQVWQQLVSVADDKLFQFSTGIASLLGLLISVLVWVKTRRIAAEISSRIRLPELAAQLATDLSELNRLNYSHAAANEIAACLAKCSSRLHSIGLYNSAIGGRPTLKFALWTTRRIAFFGWDGATRKLSLFIYAELLIVVEDIGEFKSRIPFGV